MLLMAVTPRADRQVRIVAADFGSRASFSLDRYRIRTTRTAGATTSAAWPGRCRRRATRSAGMNIAVSSDVPMGSGLSSSAAIEVATAYAFQIVGDLTLDGAQRALLCQKAENDFVGMRCGIMDQFIISLGQRGHALLIDCRRLAYTPVPLPQGCDVVICDTKKRRGLVDTEYNRRREECETRRPILGVPRAAGRDPGATAGPPRARWTR